MFDIIPIAMLKALYNFVLLACLCPLFSYGLYSSPADTVPQLHLSVGSKKAGICFGNAPLYSGLRFNVVNSEVRRTNGLDVSVYNHDDKSDTGHTSNGISLAVIYNMVKISNGISIGGILNLIGTENGIAIGGIANILDKQNGISLSGMFTRVDTVNGLAISLCALTSMDFKKHNNRVNGVAIAGWLLNLSQVNGIALAAMNKSEVLRGVSIGVYNKSEKLRGIQVGLFNIAENNPRLFRRLPFFNMHLGK